MNHRINPGRWTIEEWVSICLWIGLCATWAAVPAWGKEEQTAAPAGIISGVPTREEPALTDWDSTPEGDTLPGGTVPGGTLPGGTLAGGTVPGGTIPGGTLPGGTFPNETVPGGTLAGGAVSGGTVPSQDLPGEGP